MPCFNPRKAWPSREVNPSGKRSLVFAATRALNADRHVMVPCNRCNGCLSDRRKEWATRLLHEAKSHERSCGFTVTYRDESYPADGCPPKAHIQEFMQRVRNEFGRGIKFFVSVDYSPRTGRLHWHGVLFGVDFREDRRQYGKSHGGAPKYLSETLTRLWTHGDRNEVETMSIRWAMYCIGHMLDKAKVSDEFNWALQAHPVTGEGVRLVPPFAMFSRRPGIGHAHFEKYRQGIFPTVEVERDGKTMVRHDEQGSFIVVDGRRRQVPRYYLRLEEKLASIEDIKRARKRKQITPEAKANNTPERLKVRSKVLAARLKGRKRSL